MTGGKARRFLLATRKFMMLGTEHESAPVLTEAPTVAGVFAVVRARTVAALGMPCAKSGRTRHMAFLREGKAAREARRRTMACSVLRRQPGEAPVACLQTGSATSDQPRRLPSLIDDDGGKGRFTKSILVFPKPDCWRSCRLARTAVTSHVLVSLASAQRDEQSAVTLYAMTINWCSALIACLVLFLSFCPLAP
jgi:hypothetical protein